MGLEEKSSKAMKRSMRLDALQSDEEDSDPPSPAHDQGPHEGGNAVVHSQEDLFGQSGNENQEKEVDEMCGQHQDRFTQARTQVESVLYEDEEGPPTRRHSKTETVKVRKGYADLNARLTEQRSKLADSGGTEALTELVTTANMLIDQVHTTNEATLDSRFLSAAAEIGAEKIQKLPFGMHSFGLTDWLDLVKGNLSRFHQHQQLKTTSSQQEGVHYPAQEKCREAWESIGNRAMVYWKGVMTTDFLCGPIAVVPKEKQARSSTRRTGSDSRAPTKEALAMTKEAFEAQAAANNNATSNNVMLVAEALSAYESVPLYRFVTHPASFSRSVENLFYVSFLISDGRAALSLEKDGEILIRPLEEGDGQEDGEDEGTTMRVMPKNQRVFNFSMFQWRQAIKIYRISKPLIDF